MSGILCVLNETGIKTLTNGLSQGPMIKMKNKKGSICSRSTPSHYSNLPWNVRPLEYQTYHKKKGKISTAAVGSSTQTCGGPRGCPITGPHPLLYHPHTHHSSREPSTLRTAPSALATSSPHYSLPGSPIPSPYIYIYIYTIFHFLYLYYLFIYLLFLINLKIIKKKENALLTCWHICSASKIKKNYPIEALQGNTGVDAAIISHFRVVFPPLVFFLSPHFHFHFHSLSATSSILYFNLGSGLGFWLLFLIAYGSLMEQLLYLGFHLCC